jgi:HK97 family phage prohead protease
MKYLTAPFEVKALGDTGSFSGYASVFGNVDLGGDIVERGAFKELATTPDGQVVILNQHDMRQPVGKASVKEDDRGLYFEGQLLLSVAKAREVYELMKAGIVSGMSIGYDVLSGGAEVTNAGVRKLKSLKLWEISVVTFGMNPLAGIESVKTVDQITSIREFEDFLRDAGGFSKAQAKLLASGGWKALPAHRDDAGDVDFTQLLNTVQSFTKG